MAIIKATIPIGLGDLLYVRGILDTVKHKYEQIRLNLHREIINSYHIHPDYNIFLDEIGQLLFSEHPYILLPKPEAPFYGLVSLCNDNGIDIVNPNLSKIMCKGEPLSLNQEYIVLNTKIRYLDRYYLDSIIPQFWAILNMLGDKYKIVILGEKSVEMHRGYEEIGNRYVYSIYDGVLNNLRKDQMIDLTVPALGKTSPQLSKVQQDCLLMNKSKFVITFGVGGGFCMATSVANVIGFRTDSDPLADVLFDQRSYLNTIVTKNWGTFMSKLQSYL